MSFGYHFQAPPSSSGIRSRRNPHRSSALKSFQMVRPREELTNSPTVPTFVEKFEAGRSFDVEDDFAFIPELCTEEEVCYVSCSDRSSTSSGSPQSSPLQHQVQPSPAYPHVSAYASMFSNSFLKYQTPVPSRHRNAIPIVNPSTGMRVASPPLPSPGRVGSHSLSRRAW
ncbi:hypothetical protein BDD12DRAFT_762475 [Trichophaea hybrida]|nr:hypothetical protein BDD12DRAFT_762475 [Trichophaea hybrida]